MPRVVRKQGAKAKKVYKKHNYRDALPLLLIDFEDRCAYSMVHRETLADRQLHVDHFDPKKKKASTYDNLFPAYDVVNEAKRDAPIVSFVDPAAHLLNPCVHDDYGALLFENHETGEIVPHPDSPAAAYHVMVMDLNNRNLTTLRRDRTLKRKLLAQKFETNEEQAAILKQMEKDLDKSIKFIPELPPQAVGES